MRISVTILIILSVIFGTFSDARAEVVVFGDSLSDTGNLYLSPGTAPLFDPDGPIVISRFPTGPFSGGRASNGDIWIEQLAALLGQSAIPSLAGGTNYAFISALTREQPGLGIQSPYGVPDMDTQIDMYLATNTPDPSDLFVLWGGANDFFFGQTDPLFPVMALIGQIARLRVEGAMEFVVPNLPLLGMTPTGAATYPAQLNLWSAIFNSSLNTGLDSLRFSLGVTIHEVDTEAFFQSIIVDPAAFGFTNVDEPAVATDLTPGSPYLGFPTFPTAVVWNPEKYLFWDGVHPTTEAHMQLGDTVYYQVIPEPTSLVLLTGLGVMGLIAARRRRKQVA